jgi:hypothetical protein
MSLDPSWNGVSNHNHCFEAWEVCCGPDFFHFCFGIRNLLKRNIGLYRIWFLSNWEVPTWPSMVWHRQMKQSKERHGSSLTPPFCYRHCTPVLCVVLSFSLSLPLRPSWISVERSDTKTPKFGCCQSTNFQCFTSYILAKKGKYQGAFWIWACAPLRSMLQPPPPLSLIFFKNTQNTLLTSWFWATWHCLELSPI